MKKYKREILKEEHFTESKASLSEYYDYIFWEDMDDLDLSHYDCGNSNCWCQISYEYIDVDVDFGRRNRFNSLLPIDMESFRDKTWKRNKKINEILNSELDEN